MKKIYEFLEKYDPGKVIIQFRRDISIKTLYSIPSSLENATLKKSAEKELLKLEKAYIKLGKATEKKLKIKSEKKVTS